MVKSLCIKTNSNTSIDYLINNLKDLKLDNVYMTNSSFKIYNNIIIHYKGELLSTFYNNISEILSNLVIDVYEKTILKRLITSNYFYFNEFEKQKILNIALHSLKENSDTKIASRKDLLFVAFLKYILENKAIILDGFINFRLKDYISILDECIDSSVNTFLIEKEYNEFISLLKLYINSKDSQTDIVHLIYSNGESTLLDKNEHTILINDNAFNAKYLSDITFSSNDYSLNTLLTLLPKHIYIHLLDKEDEFIDTLKLIFADRISICNDCNICSLFKLLKNVNN